YFGVSTPFAFSADDTPTPALYTLSLHDALPISRRECVHVTGSLKFDGAETNRANPRSRSLAELAGFREHEVVWLAGSTQEPEEQDRKSTRLNSSHVKISYAVFCLKKKKNVSSSE